MGAWHAADTAGTSSPTALVLQCAPKQTLSALAHTTHTQSEPAVVCVLYGGSVLRLAGGKCEN